jgi:GNAT superfamily N-acetyltransferase
MNGEDITIRDARPDEYETIREVTLAAYAQYATLMPHWTMYSRLLLTTLEAGRSAERIVAERNGVIVGSVLLFPATAKVYEDAHANTGYPEIRLLAVLPAARGLGIGLGLLDECERRARRSGAPGLGLHTEDIMEAAVRMYTSRGYVRVPEADFSPSPGVIVKGYRRNLVDSDS